MSDEPRYTRAEYMAMAMSDEILDVLGFEHGMPLRKFLEVLIESYKVKQPAPAPQKIVTPADDDEYYKVRELKLRLDWTASEMREIIAQRLLVHRLATTSDTATPAEIVLLRHWGLLPGNYDGVPETMPPNSHLQ